VFEEIEKERKRKREESTREVFEMSKTKFGLSFLIALAMMLVFSIAAMAAGVTGLKANVENGIVKASWTKDAAATEYTVEIKDGSTLLATKTVAQPSTGTVVNFTSDTTVAKDKKYTIIVTSVGVATPNTSTVEFWAPASNKEITSTDKDNGIGNANQTGEGVTTNTGATNTDVVRAVGMVKNDGTTGTHRTHGEYQNNTNSCASCHQTHTGASKSLLFKDGVYNTCTACHDGTLGFYNVFEHSNAGTFGGTTAGNMSIHLADGTVQAKAAPGGNLSANTGAWINEFNCASCHSPHGSYSDRLLHYNPNKMGTTATKDGGIGIVGGAIVNYADLTGNKTKRTISGSEVEKTAYFWAEYDKKVANSTYVSPKFIPVRGTGLEVLKEAANTDVVIAVFEVTGETAKLTKTPWLYGYNHASPNKNYYSRFYDTNINGEQAKVQKKNAAGEALYWDGAEGTSNEVTVAQNGDGSYRLPVMVQMFVSSKDSKVGVPAGHADATATPFYTQTELTFHQPTGTWHYKYIVDNHDQDWTDKVVIDWDNGYIRAKDDTTKALFNALDTGDVGRAYVVDLDLVEIAKFGDATGVPIYKSNVDPLYDGTKSGAGVQMSTYCASCHTDYLAKSGSATGTFNQAFRHTTTSDSYTCVRCHYAHGTDVTVMMDAEGDTIEDLTATGNLFDKAVAGNESKAIQYMLDQNPSSALKRYTNMSVCWGCHTDSKAEQLKNTSSYGDDHDPHGLKPQGSMPGKLSTPNDAIFITP
jgi:predicted CXXCH cytochrome family protein